MIIAAAVCPHPPALVPQVGPGADAELGPVRRASDDAVRALLDTAPERVVVLGAGPSCDDLDQTAGGTLARYGVDVHAGGPRSVLPLSLTIGAWLLDRAGWTGPRTYSTGRPPVDGRVALLVMADCSAKRSLQAPGFLDDRAEGFDASIAAALAEGDSDALAALDLGRGDELGAAGVPPLRTLGELTKGADVTARLRYDAAPLGVGYVVADWLLEQTPAT
ncbi:hypothetical protein [Aeromicrobium chenweiae]|uniref:Uncharacterized protein n=1 Tax=Aeromicrobium chenweiae TaxID=2079793 RepID=A0A2S0WN23_9ACTN|nr:hypothetical protein [Aeromicrobium chenweiae]AWB92702.1 hypothetical protein C3E78_11090 [Aeromicrobium chenweiae]TGN33693.1 hypothetical protein E4L97_01135 [Aeromicrobium chenweiae]